MSIPRYLFLAFILFPRFGYAAPTPQAESAVAITHDAISCWPYDDFVVMQANIAPADEVETARIYFRASDFLDFYYVEMTRNQEGLFEAVMPQPTQETDRVIYYVEAVDNEFNATQTAEYDPNVVPSGSCDYRHFLGVPSIVIGSLVANVPAVPAGFQAVGITGFTAGAAMGGAAAGTGGLSTAAIAGITAAAAAGAVGIAVAATGGDDTAASGGGGTGTPGGGMPGGGTDPADIDNDGDGFSENRGDCDDTDRRVNPNGEVEFANARFQPSSVSCPEGSTNFDFRVSIRFDGTNNSCSTVDINAVDVLATVTRVQGPITNQVGESGSFNNRPANPNRLVVGQSRNGIIVNLPFNCFNQTGSESGFFEFDGELTVRTSADAYTLRTSNEFRLDFPLTSPLSAVGVGGGWRGNAGAGNTQQRRQEVILNWSSELTVPGGRGQVMFNGTSGSFAGTGRSQASSTVQTGTNVVEGWLVAANGRAGTWRFDLGDTGGVERGSLEVRMGRVELVTESSIVFRLSGSVGERVSFSFRARR
ncbi:MAG: hypothetical protein ACRD1X_08005 [Vicinamibacteria bacterium]